MLENEKVQQKNVYIYHEEGNKALFLLLNSVLKRKVCVCLGVFEKIDDEKEALRVSSVLVEVFENSEGVIDIKANENILSRKSLIDPVCDAITYLLPTRERLFVLIDMNDAFVSDLLSRAVVEFLGVRDGKEALKLIYSFNLS